MMDILMLVSLGVGFAAAGLYVFGCAGFVDFRPPGPDETP